MILSSDLLLRAYATGVFPMAESRSARDIRFVEPRMRGIFDLPQFHISRSLRRSLLRADYRIRTDTAFDAVVTACADRPETWINAEIQRAYGQLFAAGHAHSLEVWDDTGLIGGTYGVVLGAAFFGESMFSRRKDASKIALAWLVHRLRAGGFTLFDTQFLTPHLASLGAREIPRLEYQRRLAAALRRPASFYPAGYQPSPPEVAPSASASPDPSPPASSPSPSGEASGRTRSGTSQRISQTS